MTMQINIGDVWKDVDCEGSKINISGVWKAFDCDDETGGGAGAVQIGNISPGIWNPTTAGGSGWGGSGDCCSTSSGIFIDEGEQSETISVGGNIPLVLASGVGCPPYNWSTSNTGYSLQYATTSGANAHLNTLYVVGGTCGVHYEANAQVGVSDTCGSGVVIEVRNAGGHWASDFIVDARCYSGATPCQSCFQFTCAPGLPLPQNCMDNGPKTEIVGSERWITSWGCICDTRIDDVRWCVNENDRDGNPDYCPPSYLFFASTIVAAEECDNGGYHAVCCAAGGSLHAIWIC